LTITRTLLQIYWSFKQPKCRTCSPKFTTPHKMQCKC